jgi:broad specificity phosphatase PhoE
MNLYLIRHGETAKNRQKLLQGRSDVPLNENGRAQARQAAAFFERKGIRFDRVYASPLIRAVETARIITGEEALIRTDERLLEMDYGPYEGSSLEDPAPELIRFFSDFVHNPAPQGMEPLEHVKARMGIFLKTLTDPDPSGKGLQDNILISTHAIALKGALEELMPESGGSWWSRYIGTCSVFLTEYADGRFSSPVEILSLTNEPGV